MTRLLIIDDEAEIRSGIRDIIDWQAHGIQICGEAENGGEALRMVAATEPDLVLLDVRMPEMDGLAVMEALHTAGFSPKVIIMSGYDSFNYAQKALQLGASDYLLKPCHKETILQTVLRVKETIDGERRERLLLERLQTQFNESIPLLKEKYLIKLLNGEAEVLPRLKEDLPLFGIAIQPAGLRASVISIDYPYHFYEQYNTKDAELVKIAIRNLATEIISRAYPLETVEHDGNLVVLFNPAPEQPEESVSLLTEVKNRINSELGISVTIGLGNPAATIDKIHLSYAAALHALEAKFFLGADTVIQYDAIHRNEIGEALYPLAEEKAVLACILQGNDTGLAAAVGQFCAVLRAGNRSKSVFASHSSALYLAICHLCMERDPQAAEFLNQNLTQLASLYQLETVAEIQSVLLNAAFLATNRLHRKKGGNKAIETAVKYIAENYHRDINLETVSGSVYLSPSYFSLLFKQVMGINFVDYLNKVRIEKACELLGDIRYKTYEIAYRIGFRDEKYFSYIFKKVTGVSPTQFRSNLRF